VTSRDDYLGRLYLESDSRFKKAIELLASKEMGEWTDTSEISGAFGFSAHEMGDFTRKLGRKGFMWLDSRLNPQHDSVNRRQIRLVISRYPFIIDYLSQTA